MPKKLEN